MTEKALNDILAAYNNSIHTSCKSNWGSLLTFLGKHQQPNDVRWR
jgi:hypothetical protein